MIQIQLVVLLLLVAALMCGSVNGQAITAIQRYDDIDGEMALDNSGHAVAMSGDATTVAIGAPYNNGRGTRSGHVRVFRDTGSAWLQLGGDINGEAGSDLSVMSSSTTQRHSYHTHHTHARA
jgi:hypothetical protein